MGIEIKPSDLKYRYPRVTQSRHEPKFQGGDDGAAFNRNDLYDIIPLLAAAMDELGRDDAETLHALEDLINTNLPGFVRSRGEVFNFLVNSFLEMLEPG